MLLILKIGQVHCPEGLFHPTSANDWEGRNFTSPPPKYLDGKALNVAALSSGMPVFVWTHHERRKKQTPGQGLVAKAQLGVTPSIHNSLMQVRLEKIRLISPPISLDEMKTLSSESEAVRSLIEYTLTRSLVLDERPEEDFVNAVERFQQRKTQLIAEASGKLDNNHQSNNDEPDTGPAWTEAEISACLVAYLEMLGKEIGRESYSKAEMNRTLRKGPLASRSRGSVEFRMQNISAYFEAKGLPTISGYKPRANIGPTVTAELDRALARLPSLDLPTFESTDDFDKLRERANMLRQAVGKNKPIGNARPTKTQGTSQGFIRSPQVVAYVLNRAAGNCELCAQPAPFITTGGLPFLEVHHVRPLSEIGPDTVENAAALCPNCHRACHLSERKETLRLKLIGKVEMLIDY